MPALPPLPPVPAMPYVTRTGPDGLVSTLIDDGLKPVLGFLLGVDLDATEEYLYTERHERVVPAGSDIEIINGFGRVDVTTGDIEGITVDVTKTIVASSQAEADAVAAEWAFSISEDSTGYRVAPAFDADEDLLRGVHVATSLVVRLPTAANVSVQNRNGRVVLGSLRGDQQVSNAFGAVEVQGIDGSVRIETRNGEVSVARVTESVSIENAFGPTIVREVGGALDFASRNGELTASDVGGPAVISNAFAPTTVRRVGGNLEVTSRNGDISASGITGGARIENAFAAIEVIDVGGDLTIRGRNGVVDVERIDGNLDLEHAFGDVGVRDARGELRLATRNGDVAVRLTGVPNDSIAILTEFGSVALDLPSGSMVSLDLSTRFGQITSDFPGLIVTDRGGQSLVTRSEGPEVQVRTRNGNIEID